MRRARGPARLPGGPPARSRLSSWAWPLEAHPEGHYEFGVPLGDELRLEVRDHGAPVEADSGQEVGAHIGVGRSRAAGVQVGDAQAGSHPDEGAAVAVDVVMEVHVEGHVGTALPEDVFDVRVGIEVVRHGYDQLDSGERLRRAGVDTDTRPK